MRRHQVWVLLAGLLIGSVARAGQPRAAPVTTTQRAVITPEPFAGDEAVSKSPQALKTLSATMVSATFSATPAMQAFADLAKKTGYRIELYEGGRGQSNFGKVTATINSQPFWAAMREICTRGNVNLYYWSDEDATRITIMPSNYGNSGMMKAAASIQGPYMIVVTNIQRVNNVQMANPQNVDRHVDFQIVTFAEPKSVPVQYAYEPTIDEAVDDNGNTMTPTARDNEHRNLQGGRGLCFQGYFSIPYPTTNPAKRIARLRGHIPAVVQLGSEPIEIADPLKSPQVTKTVGGQKLSFNSLTKTENGQYQLELVYYRGERDQQAFNSLWNITPTLKLIDAKDSRYQFNQSGGRGDGEKITRQFTFYRRSEGGGRDTSADAPQPTKLIISVPTATQEIAIPFELVDLPLP
jgi:hypothetical protein